MPKIHSLATQQARDPDEWVWSWWALTLIGLIIIAFIALGAIRHSVLIALVGLAIGMIFKLDSYGPGILVYKSWFLTSLRQRRRAKQKSQASLNELHDFAQEVQNGNHHRG